MSAESIEIGYRSSFRMAAEFTIRRLVEQLIRNLPGTKSGEDIEALHDMRVASRRLRAALTVFRPCLPGRQLRRVTGGVGSVTQALGQVRDQDVFIDYLRGMSGIDVEWLIERENQIREGGRLHMIDALEEIEEGGLHSEVEEMLATGKKTDRGARFGEQAPALISTRLAKMRELSGAMQDPSDVAGLHAMRIAAKRLRYTMEAFVPCFGKPLQERIEVVKLLQDQLGEIHDCDVWVQKLEQYKKEPGLSPERIEALDALTAERTEHRRTTYEAARAHWNCLVGNRFEENLIRSVSEEPAEGKELESMTKAKIKKPEEIATAEIEKPKAETVKAASTLTAEYADRDRGCGQESDCQRGREVPGDGRRQPQACEATWQD